MDAPVHYHRTMTTLPRAARPHRSARHPLAARVLRPFSAALAVVALGGFLSACLIPPLPGSGNGSVQCTESHFGHFDCERHARWWHPGPDDRVRLHADERQQRDRRGHRPPGHHREGHHPGRRSHHHPIDRFGHAGLPGLRRRHQRQPEPELADAEQRPGQQRPTRWWRHLQPRHLGCHRRAPSPTTRRPPPPAPRVGPSTAAGRSR